jgi:hypothetical protein
MIIMRSKILFTLMTFLHIVAVVLLIFSAISYWILFASLILCAISYAHYLRQDFFLKAKTSLQAMRILDDKIIEVSFTDDCIRTMTLLPSTFIGEWFIVLHLKDEFTKKKVRCVLLKDSFEKASQRRELARWCSQYML